jgi:uncharacterized membrane protein YphA (DoxX/SURF4 family)/protein-disulfide isomerase
MRLLARVDALAVRHGWVLWAGTVGRLLLAGVFGVAGVLKLGDPAQTVRSVRAYRLLPEWLAVPFGHALPWLEVALAVLLLLGIALRLAAGVSLFLMTLFVAGISSAWARGLRIDCGCFGDGGPTANPQYGQELLRDGGLLVVSVGLLLLGRSRLALDPRTPEAPMPTASSGGSRRERVQQASRRYAYERAVRRHRSYEVGAVGLLLVAMVTGIAVGRSSLPRATSPTPNGVTARGGVMVGSARAPHHLLVYEDPQCPVCERFELVSGEVLRRAVQRGAVRIEYRMRSFLGPESVRAVAALGAAVGVGGFEPLRAQLFKDQPDEGTGGFTVEDLIVRARAVGIEDRAFVEAVRSQVYAPWARRVDDMASRDGNVGTPDLVLDGHRLPLQDAFEPSTLARALGVPVTPPAVGPAS